jgi:hypothetical membrane protein
VTGGTRLATGAAVLGLTVPLLVAVVSLAAGRLTPAYDPVRFTVSYLAARGQPYALTVNAAFALLGVSLAATAWALDRHLAGRTRAGCLLLALAGVGLLGVAVVSRDPAHPQLTALHRVIAAVALLSLGLSPLLVGYRVWRDEGWRRMAVASVAIGVVSVVELAGGGILLPRHALPGGAWERVLVGLELLWVCLIALRLLMAARRPAPDRARP